MSFINVQLRDFIIKNFMGEQVSIKPNNSLEESELDTFIEMPNVPNVSNVQKDTKLDDYELHKPKFKYLEDDVLSKEFALQREPDILELKKHSIKLCLFNVNETLSVPFLEFFLDNKLGEFDFPIKELDMPILAEIYNREKSVKINIDNTTPFQPLSFETVDQKSDIDEEEEDDFDEFEKAFFKQCAQFFQEVTFLGEDVASQRYLGFIEKEELIYVVFDCTDLDILENIHLQKKDGYFLAIIDEIMNRRMINETTISQKLVDLFQSTPLLANIYDSHNQQQQIPKLVYLCEKTESGYKNEYYEVVTDQSKSQSPSVSIINPKVNHPFFDNVYLFTSEPIEKNSQKGVMQELFQNAKNGTTLADELNNIKRYALEINLVKTYKDVDIKTLIEKQETMNPNYEVYSFMEDGREFWAAKSVKSFVEI